jgi:hypothetical protein
MTVNTGGEQQTIIEELNARIEELVKCVEMLINGPDTMKIAECEILRRRCERAIKG